MSPLRQLPGRIRARVRADCHRIAGVLFFLWMLAFPSSSKSTNASYRRFHHDAFQTGFGNYCRIRHRFFSNAVFDLFSPTPIGTRCSISRCAVVGVLRRLCLHRMREQQGGRS